MSTAAQWQCRDRVLDLGAPVVMGVLNVTPDSFSDGGRFADRDAALRACAAHDRRRRGHHRHRRRIDAARRRSRRSRRRTRARDPGHRGTAARIARVHFRRYQQTRSHARGLSRPARTSSTTCARCGAGRAGSGRGARGAGICLMHMQGEPRTMQAAPHYDDVVGEVSAFLAARVAACRDGGHRRRAPRHRSGFRIRQDASSTIWRCSSISASCEELGVPLAVGLSRKSMLAKLTGRDGR